MVRKVRPTLPGDAVCHRVRLRPVRADGRAGRVLLVQRRLAEDRVVSARQWCESTMLSAVAQGPRTTGICLNVGAKNGGHVRPPGCSCSSQHNFGLYVLGRLLLLPLLFNDLDVPLLRARAVLSPASFVAMIVVPCYLFEAPWESMLYRECSGTGLGCRSRGQSLELSSRLHRLCNAVVHYQLSWLLRMLGSTIR